LSRVLRSGVWVGGAEKSGGREMERGGNGGGGSGGAGKNSFIVAFVWIGVSVFFGLGAEEGGSVAH
jgi:hypothetical protein